MHGVSNDDLEPVPDEMLARLRSRPTTAMVAVGRSDTVDDLITEVVGDYKFSVRKAIGKIALIVQFGKKQV